MKRNRTLLFAPGDNSRRMSRAAETEADAVVFDLEDAVAQESKASARPLVADLLGRVPAGRAFVRVNAVGSADYVEDLVALEPVIERVAGVIAPKVESVDELTRLDEDLDRAEERSGRPAGSTVVLIVLESAAGILAAPSLAGHSRVGGILFGTLDLSAELGIAPTVGGTELLHARSAVVLAARAAGLWVIIDGPHGRIDDPVGIQDASGNVKNLGFTGKAVIHPAQIAPVHEAFAPSAEETAHAEAVIDAFRQAHHQGLGSVRLADGTFIDRPVVVRAASVLGLSEEEVSL